MSVRSVCQSIRTVRALPSGCILPRSCYTIPHQLIPLTPFTHSPTHPTLPLSPPPTISTPQPLLRIRRYPHRHHRPQQMRRPPLRRPRLALPRSHRLRRAQKRLCGVLSGISRGAGVGRDGVRRRRLGRPGKLPVDHVHCRAQYRGFDGCVLCGNRVVFTEYM